ncbi:MAG: GTP pyrophosphokinase family protein [Clostridiales bacterium]|nr:GTP pyrophosphokinase family protein [Clostridiales bacterium]
MMESKKRIFDDLALEEAEQFLMAYQSQKPWYSGAMKTVCAKFEVLDDEFAMLRGHDPIHHIESRLKSVESAYEKLPRRGLAPTAENLTKLNDIAGVRVICSYVKDVYDIADVFLRQEGVVLIQKKDYIENPKANGYRSLHLIASIPVCLSKETRHVPVEIQLRTISMNMWASLEHEVSYKVNADLLESYRAELKTCADEMHAVEKKMQDICLRIRSQT